MFETVITELNNHLAGYGVSVLATLVVLMVYYVLARVLASKIKSAVSNAGFKDSAEVMANRSYRTILTLVVFSVVLFIWGFDFRGLLVLSSSILAVTGVALFASWSLLSNITAFFMLLLLKPYKLDTYIRVFDGENFIEGAIREVSLFATTLEAHNGERIAYPNNLLVSRPIMLNPVRHVASVGKSADLKDMADTPPS